MSDQRPFRLDVEDLLTTRGWKPVERVLSRKVNVFFEHPDFKGTFGASAAIHAQMRKEER